MIHQMDLATFYDKSGCECLNESNGHNLAGALTSKEGFLESDCDEQVRRLAFARVSQTLEARGTP